MIPTAVLLDTKHLTRLLRLEHIDGTLEGREDEIAARAAQTERARREMSMRAVGKTALTT